MITESTDVEYASGCEMVVEDTERRSLLWLMAEFFRTLGYTDLKARLPGFLPPPLLAGTLENHRPDFTCRQSDSAQTPLIMEVVTTSTVEDLRMENRWSLLASAAHLYNAELHFVAPKWASIGAVDAALRRRLDRMALPHNRIWSV